MAVTSNIGAFVARTRKVAATLPAAERVGVHAAAAVTKAGVLASARSRRAKPQESWVSVQARGPGALVQLRGARAYWAERGTKAHDVKPKGKKAITTPAGPRARARVGGARAKPFWRAGLASARPVAVEAHRKAVGAALRQAFR